MGYKITSFAVKYKWPLLFTGSTSGLLGAYYSGIFKSTVSATVDTVVTASRFVFKGAEFEALKKAESVGAFLGAAKDIIAKSIYAATNTLSTFSQAAWSGYLDSIFDGIKTEGGVLDKIKDCANSVKTGDILDKVKETIGDLKK
jgi:hypothetical protein